jgi:hypothetical protein
LKDALNLRQPDFRMRDVELVLRFFAYRIFAREYSGDLKKFLDETTKKLNINWESRSEDLQSVALDLDQALITTESIFGKDQFRKWNGSNYERRINRAVFDIMTYYFSIEEIRIAAAKKSDEIKSAFEKLCKNDQDFLTSLETTTKSTEANKTRFGKWANKLSEILGFNVPSAFE